MGIKEQAVVSKYDNHEAIQGAELGRRKYTDATISASTDPFASKDNKYAETNAVKISAIDKGIWVIFSSEADQTAATVNGSGQSFVHPNTDKVFTVEDDKRYLRVIEDSATARIVVEEL